MVVGNGLIAQRFKCYDTKDNVLIFASGVSNSKERRTQEFEREKKLLYRCISGMKRSTLFIYFSTCSVDDPEENISPYVRHKLYIENEIAKKTEKYLLLRLPQLFGSTHNKNTIVNYLVDSIEKSKEFELWKNAYRNLIDIDDAFIITDYIIRNNIFSNCTVNIANRNNISVIEMVKAIETFLNKKAIYKLCDKGSNYFIDIKNIEPYLKANHILFGKDYFHGLLMKYYFAKHFYQDVIFLRE
jgi:nucleoside-diphosphate-sugar epimerase